MKAIRIHDLGGPEVLKYEDCPNPIPGPGQALINVQAIGVNFADVSGRRGGAGPPPTLPTIPGFEAAGLVSAVGDGAGDVKVGDTVVYWGVRGHTLSRQPFPPTCWSSCLRS